MTDVVNANTVKPIKMFTTFKCGIRSNAVVDDVNVFYVRKHN